MKEEIKKQDLEEERRREESEKNILKPIGDILSSLKANNTKKHREINQKHSNVKTEKLKKDGILKFSNQSEAKLFIRDLTDNLSKNVNEIFNELDNMINSTKDEFIPSLNKDIEQSIGSIIVEIKERIGEDIEIKIPTLKIDKNKSKLDYFDKSITEKSRQEKIKKEQEGIKGKVKRFFGELFRQDDWGYDDDYKEIKDFIISKDSIDENIDKAFQNVSSEIKTIINDLFKNQIEKEIRESVSNLIQEIELYREEMLSVEKKKQADAFDKEKEIALTKEDSESSKRLNERILKLKDELVKSKING